MKGEKGFPGPRIDVVSSIGASCDGVSGDIGEQVVMVYLIIMGYWMGKLCCNDGQLGGKL